MQREYVYDPKEVRVHPTGHPQVTAHKNLHRMLGLPSDRPSRILVSPRPAVGMQPLQFLLAEDGFIEVAVADRLVGWLCPDELQRLGIQPKPRTLWWKRVGK